MEYLLFSAYLVLFAWLVTKIKFFTRSGLTKAQLIIIFLLKILAGIFYGWIGLYYGGHAQMQDTWAYHAGSLEEYELLFNNPEEYLTNLFRDPYDSGTLKFFSSHNSYWNDLKGNVFIKFLSVLNIFSFGHYYINLIFYSFITFFGAIAVYRVMTHLFPGKKLAVIYATFLIPSFLYWTSGLHKEGLLFTGLGVVVFSMYTGILQKKFDLKRMIASASGFLLLLVLRNYLLVILIPGLLAWCIAMRRPAFSLTIFSSVYLLFAVLFFTARYIHPNLNFPASVVAKQQDFLNLKGGNSSIPIRELEPHFSSFLKNAPQSFSLSVLRPYPSDARHLLSLAAALETSLLLILFFLFLLWHRPLKPIRHSVVFFLFFSFSVLMSIGYSVNNLGAIVRYRSIIIPFLIVPMFALMDWQRIGRAIGLNMKNNNTI